ncbi:hypothetical protein ACGC1H_007690 [Rhizoctonia solani]|uniref:F-box domain-containing protein n=1 Tax=Rhizoctonia solani TaxID=456999 RepID=A0A8H3C6J2_9AGAM|nr:unnamed protein product [Rhizoctonia solani]
MATAIVSHGTTPWPIGNIQRWEESGAQLESAIAAYLHSCLALEQSTSTTPPIGIDNLPARLSRRIEYFHTLMTQPLAQSLASVARTRNKLVTSIYRIPSEVLERIFGFAVNGAGIDLPMRSATSASCLCLYRILSVCSVWRKVGLAHARLWTLVPLVDSNRSRIITVKSANFSLERAGRSELYLVADLGIEFGLIPWSSLTKILVENGPRFRTINLRSSSHFVLEHILDPILATTLPGSISDLSLSHDPTIAGQPQPTGTTRLLGFDIPSKQATFESVLSSLRVLRLDNILPRMGNLAFGGLVELRIQAISFETDLDLREFLRRLVSASCLQTLDIISVAANEAAASLPPSHEDLCSIPSLQTLFLDNLSSNVIHTVLSSIKSGTHRTILSVTNEIYIVQRPERRVHTGIFFLQNATQSHNIDTLIIGEGWFPFDSAESLHSLLSILPNITTIYFDEQHLDRASLVALTRRPDISEPQVQLRRLYISCSGIDDIGDQTAFKNMLSSHPLEELVLGARLSEVAEIIEPGNASNGDLDSVEIIGPDVRTISIKTWLQENVPKLTLLEGTKRVQYKSSEWQLW